MGEFLVYALAVWIVSHTVTVEILSKAHKPFSCQLCFSGWFCISAGIVGMAENFDIRRLWVALAIWAAAVLIEAAYNRLQTLIL